MCNSGSALTAVDRSCSIVRSLSSTDVADVKVLSAVDTSDTESCIKKRNNIITTQSSDDLLLLPGEDPPGFVASVNICNAKVRNRIVKRKREASQQTKHRASMVAAVTTLLIFTWAIRSCIPTEVTTWHKATQGHLRSTPEKTTTTVITKRYVNEFMPDRTDHRRRRLFFNGGKEHPQEENDFVIPPPPPESANPNHRRLTHMEYAHKFPPSDLKKLHHANQVDYSIKQDPSTSVQRKAMPLFGREYKINPLLKPDGYPWHKWGKPNDGSYPLNTAKYVSILSQLGAGEDTLGTVTPNNYTVGGVKLTPDVIRLGPHVRPYIIKDGTVLRPQGRTGMFVTLVQRAVEMAASLADQSPRMKLLTEGEIPLIFDANDYPWCGDDYVPIFRLNAIRSTECKHSWPAMSLTYFQDPTNVQLAESPYQWDEMMATYDETYPWKSKFPKLVWRGRITGYTYPDGERPRQELVRFSRDFLDIMDVKPSTKRSRIPQDDFMKYKAILDIDGNAWSARLGKLLCYNSVVIKVEPEFVGYWEKEIEPWVHYIPVESDFSDLEKTVRYVIDPKNAKQMQQIVKNAQQFCRTKLTMEQYTVDIMWTLLSYAELLANSPDFYTAWKKDSNAYKMPGMKMAEWKPRVAAAS